MKPVSLALFWHQHQPYYPDDIANETLMPWVRLHATKDYIGMALHIQEVPEFHCTINLVPSLLVQIERYVNGGSDRHLDVSRIPADSLSLEDTYYLFDNFFMANEQSMIRPHKRYSELHQKRGIGRDSVQDAHSRFTNQELRDLQVWHNLAWFHELLFEKDAELREFRKKGAGWTEAEKTWLLDKQREIVGRVIPLHRKLMEGGQVELTTTPFYHPILPLLWDKKSAWEAMPGCPMPKYVESYSEDAQKHLAMAVEYHTKLFGEAPRGLWPSEGSVSNAILETVADNGFKWLATDEEILGHSMDQIVSRDDHGNLNRPEMLYRPWRTGTDQKPLDIIFRDHGLSDLIGFHYQRNEPRWAAEDLLAKVKGIGRAVAEHDATQTPFVPIILDGENCWEYYADGGIGFLRNLYQQAVKDPGISTLTVSEHLAKHPPTSKIPKLFAGSWINHDFYIWIGHQEDRDAWDLVHITREFLTKAEESGTASAETLEQAWKELFIAEGSDWYWWYGDDHNSGQDDLFDDLFRRHLRNVYTLLGELPPSVLFEPVAHFERRHLHTQPQSLLNVKVNGRVSFFEWRHAGHYESGSERGTMTMVTESVITNMYFGFDEERLLLRCDTQTSAKTELGDFDEIRIRFVEPFGAELRIDCKNPQTPKLVINGEERPDTKSVAAIDQLLEVAIPYEELGAEENQRLHLAVELIRDGEAVERSPSEGTIDLTIPSEDFEMLMWQA
ncbi:alpha-amylase/alpha-mannosidase [Thalassoglobus sp.]|uniref:alpha-amylase/alpha-mannosidase n=1 Tax=Thalassoglobus sp. TaxID=2795869 RepID=UPI003AA8A4AE